MKKLLFRELSEQTVRRAPAFPTGDAATENKPVVCAHKTHKLLLYSVRGRQEQAAQTAENPSVRAACDKLCNHIVPRNERDVYTRHVHRLTGGAFAMRIEVGEHRSVRMSSAQQAGPNQTLALRSPDDFHLRIGGEVILQLFFRVRCGSFV